MYLKELIDFLKMYHPLSADVGIHTKTLEKYCYQYI